MDPYENIEKLDPLQNVMLRAVHVPRRRSSILFKLVRKLFRFEEGQSHDRMAKISCGLFG